MGGFAKKATAFSPAVQVAKAVTAKSKQQEAEAPTTLDTSGDAMDTKRRGKRKLRVPVTQTAGTNVGGEGASGLQIPKG